jgi:uncharacterized protein (DUF433 family)
MPTAVHKPGDELITPAEASAVSGVPVKAIYKLAREGLPNVWFVHYRSKLFLRPGGAVCARLDHELAKADVPVDARRNLFCLYAAKPSAVRIEWEATDYASFVLKPAHVEREVMRKLKAYRDATTLVVEDPGVQNGAATFKGTRILVHTIAGLLAQGADTDELKEDYPALTDRMLEVAPLYAKANPKRGRPRSPVWRGQIPAAETRSRRAS